jgi:hypothetical protein
MTVHTDNGRSVRFDLKDYNKNAGDEPARQAQFDNSNQCAVRIEGVRRSAQVVQLLHGALHRFISATMDAISSPPPRSISFGGFSDAGRRKRGAVHQAAGIRNPSQKRTSLADARLNLSKMIKPDKAALKAAIAPWLCRSPGSMEPGWSGSTNAQ